MEELKEIKKYLKILLINVVGLVFWAGAVAEFIFIQQYLSLSLSVIIYAATILLIALTLGKSAEKVLAEYDDESR